MKNLLATTIIVMMLPVIDAYSQQSELGWYAHQDMSIKIFSDKFSITNLSSRQQSIITNEEVFSNRIATISNNLEFPAYSMKTINSGKTTTFVFTPTNETYESSIVIGISKTQDDAIKEMLGRIVSSSLPPDKIAERFKRLPSAPEELILLETKTISVSDKKRESKVLHHLTGNVFTITHEESGLERSVGINARIQEMIQSMIEEE